MEKEIWKDVVGYEGLYQVSSLGKVASVKRRKCLRVGKENKGYCEVRLCKSGVIKNFRVHILVYRAFVGDIPYGMEIDHINCVRDDNRIENLRAVTHKENMSNPLTIKKLKSRTGSLRYNYGKSHTEEVRKKISESLSSSPLHPWRGKHLSKNHREKISEARMGQRLTEETKIKKSKPILQFSKDGVFVKEWLSATCVQNELGISKCNICKNLKGEINSAYGYIWKYKEIEI